MARSNKLGQELYLRHLEAEEKGDINLAKRYLIESASLGEPMANHAIAYEMYGKEGGNKSDAIDLYVKAAKKKFGPSIWNLARHFELTDNPRAYFHWIKKAADLGDVDAISELKSPFPYLVKMAMELEEKGEYDKAISLLKLPVEYNNAYAQNMMANIIDLHFINKNNARVTYLYKKAIGLGNKYAAWNLSQHYKERKKTKLYLKYLNIAADMNHKKAQLEIGK